MCSDDFLSSQDYQTIPVRVYPFKIDRRKLSDALQQANPSLVVSHVDAAAHGVPLLEVPPAKERDASSAVQVMRAAYASLVGAGAITTGDSGTSRYNKVRNSEEVKGYVAKCGSERGLSLDTFEREVLRSD